MKPIHLFLTLLLLSIWYSNAIGQVSTEPAVPSADHKVTIIFDATAGTGGLKGCDCDVFIHIGAVTESAESTTWSIVPFEWGTTDANAKMTKVAGESNLYTYELTTHSKQKLRRNL